MTLPGHPAIGHFFLKKNKKQDFIKKRLKITFHNNVHGWQFFFFSDTGSLTCITRFIVQLCPSGPGTTCTVVAQHFTLVLFEILPKQSDTVNSFFCLQVGSFSFKHLNLFIEILLGIVAKLSKFCTKSFFTWSEIVISFTTSEMEQFPITLALWLISMLLKSLPSDSSSTSSEESSSVSVMNSHNDHVFL